MAVLRKSVNNFLGVKVLVRHVSATASDVNHILTQEKLNLYHKNGYLVVKKLFDTNTVEKMRERFIELCNGERKNNKTVRFVKDYALEAKGGKPEDYINKIQSLLHDEVFSTYSEDPKLLSIISQLLGTEDLVAINCMMINKPAGTIRHPAHQDSYYLPIRPEQHIAASWTAIDAATLDNGCLFCVPGSHKELKEHEIFQESKVFYHKIKDEHKLASVNHRIYFEMSPGDTLFFHPMLIHGTGSNITKKPRKSAIAHYMDAKCRYVDLTGTIQEPLIEEYRLSVSSKGLGPDTYQDFWRSKSKAMPKVFSSK